LSFMAEYGKSIGKVESKWKKMDKKKAEKYGVPVNSHNAKSGSCYAFMEMSKANKCKKVMIYPTLPDSNRSLLGEANTTSGGETALGNRAGASIGKVIAEQEARRLNTPLASEAPSSDSAKPVRHVTVVRKPAEKASDSAATASTRTTTGKTSRVVASAEPEEEEMADEFEDIKVESRFNLSSVQAAIGLKGVSPTMLIGGAVAIVVLLTLIGMLRGSGERKKLSRYRNRRY